MQSAFRYLMLGVFFAVPFGAVAQAPYSVGMRPEAFQPLPLAGGTETTYPSTTSNGDQWVQHIPLPFSVRFFDVEKSDLYVSSNGWISFDATTNSSHSNAAIPTAAAPNNLIAPFWDDLGCDSLKSQILGTAPARTVIVEFPCYRWSTRTSTMEMQVWLFEGSSTIEIHYGAIAGTNWNATMGIENATGSTGYWIPSKATGANCTNNCAPSDWHANSVVVFSQGPELRVAEVHGQAEGFAGVPMGVRAVIQNVGGEPASDFTVRFWVSPTPSITAESMELLTLDGDVRSLDPQGRTTYEAEVRLPAELEEGSWYILAEADPRKAVPETNRGDNVGAFGPFVVGIRAPNLVGGYVEVSDERIAPGGEASVRFEAANLGNLPATRVPYRISLSRHPYVNSASVVVASGRIDGIPAQESITWDHGPLTLPKDLVAGYYYLAVSLDPDREIFEHDRSDNVALSFPILVGDDDLVIVMDELPPATIEGHYSVRLDAAGGDGVVVWSLREGETLPPGLSLVVEEGADGAPVTFLRGIPSSVGTFAFVLRAYSGGVAAERSFRLEVVGATYALSVTNQVLAHAAFGFAYREELMAVGGRPPYAWSVAKGNLPQGILLSEDGILAGSPSVDGAFPVTVRVVDANGAAASAVLELRVSPPSRLTCVTRELPEMHLGERIRADLLAAGGAKRAGGSPYVWSPGVSVRLATGVGQEPKDFSGPPPGLELREGRVSGTPLEIGDYIWSVELRDAAGGFVACPIRVRVPADRGLTAITQTVPTAIAGRSYEVQLDAVGGDAPYAWAELGDGRVLERLGLSFAEEGGLLRGTPPSEVLEGESARDFSFLVRVRDRANRVGIAPMTIRVEMPPSRTPAAEEPKKGCQAAAGAPSAWALSVLGLLLLGARRCRKG